MSHGFFQVPLRYSGIELLPGSPGRMPGIPLSTLILLRVKYPHRRFHMSRKILVLIALVVLGSLSYTSMVSAQTPGTLPTVVLPTKPPNRLPSNAAPKPIKKSEPVPTASSAPVSPPPPAASSAPVDSPPLAEKPMGGRAMTDAERADLLAKVQQVNGGKPVVPGQVAAGQLDIPALRPGFNVEFITGVGIPSGNAAMSLYTLYCPNQNFCFGGDTGYSGGQGGYVVDISPLTFGLRASMFGRSVVEVMFSGGVGWLDDTTGVLTNAQTGLYWQGKLHLGAGYKWFKGGVDARLRSSFIEHDGGPQPFEVVPNFAFDLAQLYDYLKPSTTAAVR